jgi:hypothetical protein
MLQYCSGVPFMYDERYAMVTSHKEVMGRSCGCLTMKNKEVLFEGVVENLNIVTAVSD